MDYLERKKFLKKDKAWRKRVNEHLPRLIVKFYQAKIDGFEIPTEIEKKLGRLIKDINNPFYLISNNKGEPLSDENMIAFKIILEIEVDEFFEYMNMNFKQL